MYVVGLCGFMFIKVPSSSFLKRTTWVRRGNYRNERVFSRMVTIKGAIRAIWNQSMGTGGLYDVFTIGQVNYSYRYTKARQTMVRTLMGVIRAKAIALGRFGMHPRVVYRYSQLHFLRVNGS